MSDLPKTLSINPEIILQKLDDQTALLNPNTGQVFGLDRVSSRVWELIEAHSELSQVRAQMLEDFDVEEAQLDKDLLMYIRQLIELGLVLPEPREP